MLQQDRQQQPGIAGIALGARRLEGIPEVSRRVRVHREQHQLRELEEHIHQRTSRLLQTHRDRPAAKTLAQIRYPRHHRFRRVVEFALFPLLGTGGDELPVVLLIGPVEGYKRGIFRLLLNWGGHFMTLFLRHTDSPFHRLMSGQTWLRRKAYSESGTRQHLSIRYWTQAHPAARDTPQDIACRRP